VLRAAREVVIPVPLTFLALDGCAELSRTIETVRTRYGNRDLHVSMVIPTFYRRTRLAQEVLDSLKAAQAMAALAEELEARQPEPRP
jgi:chromosome partitioning protein